ncbi:lysophospholipase L1-like esterase [Marmoricola sp. URHA0025 HA25]
MTAAYRRFVALGDSQTEGLNDLDASGTPIGWADRLAAALDATTSPGLSYANLAVRGARAADVFDRQLPAALALEPDLATVAVGMNDVLRHDYDPDRTVQLVEQTFAALTATGCRVLTMTFPDIALMLPLLARLRPREEALNLRIKEAAERHGVEVLDLFPMRLCADPQMWSHDRIHGSSIGHTRIAAAMAALLELPGADDSWVRPEEGLRPAEVAGRFERWVAVSRDAHWVATFLVPFLTRQLLRRGARRLAKRPVLLPVQQHGRPALAGEAAGVD